MIDLGRLSSDRSHLLEASHYFYDDFGCPLLLLSGGLRADSEQVLIKSR